jgi:hypothetical protein
MHRDALIWAKNVDAFTNMERISTYLPGNRNRLYLTCIISSSFSLPHSRADVDAKSVLTFCQLVLQTTKIPFLGQNDFYINWKFLITSCAKSIRSMFFVRECVLNSVFHSDGALLWVHFVE